MVKSTTGRDVPGFTERDALWFWAMVDTTAGPGSCWPWLSYRDRQGYGRYGPNAPAHRLAWRFRHGAIAPGLLVCHACDNPCCCNPAHLWLGTNAENTADKMAKGRHRSAIMRGERNGQAKLSREDVLKMRSLRSEGATTTALARQFGCSRRPVDRIVTGEKWAHVA